MGKLHRRFLCCWESEKQRQSRVGFREGNEKRGQGKSGGNSRLQILKFESNVRRVALVHVFDDKCKFNREEKISRQSKNAISGGGCEFLTTIDGYPPHFG